MRVPVRDEIWHDDRLGDAVGAIRSYPSRELMRLRRTWLRRNRRPVLIVLAFHLGAISASTWWGLAFGGAAVWYAVGLLHAGLVASLLHLVNSAVLAHEPRAVFQLRGAWGEDNTRSELARAKKKRLLWGWVDSLPMHTGDLDHVVVTRSGGVVVLDSKFRTGISRTDVSEMTATAVRGRTRAEATVRTVLKGDKRARHRASGTSVAVTSCVVLWGPARQTVPDGRVIDGVHFIDGRRLHDWLRGLPSSPVTKEAATDLLERLADYRESVEAARG